MNERAITLSGLNRAIAGILSTPQLTNLWVIAELMDLRVVRGHCYMELVEKHPDTGAVVARLRAVIWASSYQPLADRFHRATGQALASGLKVMLRGSVNYHPAFGMSFVINDIDPAYTMGEAERRRREILERLRREGVLNDNRSLEWPRPALRVAVISAGGAAGYGDFINQLYHSPSRLRFTTRLFPAAMQGERTAPSVIAALESIASDYTAWDCVVIIRGGGASSELQAFDDYQLAFSVAQFPLPVIVGIGHERDVTVLDYVANTRVKTPTAAAEKLISLGEEALQEVLATSAEIFRIVTERANGARTQLAHLSSALSVAPSAAFDRARARLQQATTTLAGAGGRRIAPELARLDHKAQSMATAIATTLRRKADRLDSAEQLLKALSPQATLNRGYSLTTLNGKAVTDSSQLKAGDVVTTFLANGKFSSEVK